MSDIEKVVNGIDINKSMGLDGVSSKMLKECQEELLEPILYIMKTDYNGTSPNGVKESRCSTNIHEWMSNGAIEI